MDQSIPFIKLSLFGSWQLQHTTTSSVKLPRRKEQALLAYLALESEQPHSRDSLVGLFWPDLSSSDARNNLRVALSRLKRQLRKIECLETTRHTITFVPTEQFWIDVDQFLQLSQHPENHAHDSLSVCQECQSSLKQAMALYRSEFLAGFYLEGCLAFEDWLFIWRERLHLQMLKLLGQLNQIAEQAGHFAEAAQYARRQIELDPLYEQAHRQLMRALVGQGQRSAALHQFQSCAEVLQEQLGVEPDAETQQLAQAIESGRLDLTPGASETVPPSQPASHFYALPENSTPFIGREHELLQLTQRLTEQKYRLISLIGPGGIGKTRLAIQAGRQVLPQFRDGVYLVPLVGVQSPVDIPAAVAEAMALPLVSDHHDPAEQVIANLRPRQTLLIIDNLEHLIAGADLLLDWLEQAPNLVLLVTSRERINAQVEDIFRLKGLPWPKDEQAPDAATYEAVRLFGDRAHRLNKQFCLNEETLPGVVRICQLVEGLPLALELAASSIWNFDVETIAASISSDTDMLATDFRDVPSRHRQFEAVFEHSWRLLSTAEQAALPRLALFRGGFTRSAAIVVLNTTPLTLTRLRHKSLIRADGSSRLGMHELLRQLAEKKLRAQPDVWVETQTNHARYYLNLLQEKSPLLSGPQAAKTAQLLREEIDNIRAAWQTVVSRLDVALIQGTAPALAEFYAHIGLSFEGGALLEQALAALKNSEDTLKRDTQILLIVKKLSLLYRNATEEEFVPYFETFLTLLDDIPEDVAYEAEARYYYSYALAHGTDQNAAISQIDQALVLAKSVADPALLGRILCQRAYFYYRSSQPQEAQAMLEDALQIFESLDHLKGQARVHGILAPTYAENGNYWQALVNDRQALELYQQLGDHSALPKAHHAAALSYMLFGAFDLVRHHTHQAIKLSRQQEDEREAIGKLSILAELAFLEGNFEESKRLGQRCIQFWRAEGINFRLCLDLVEHSRTLWQLNELAEAQLLLEEAVERFIEFNNFYELVAAQTLLALIYWEQNHKHQALQILEEIQPKIDPYSLMEPIKTLYDMYHVFHRANHPATKIVVQQAHEVLNHLTQEITDPNMRHSLLNNVCYCVWLQEAFDVHHLDLRFYSPK